MMKMYHASSFALAGLVPAAAIAPGGQAAIDLALGVAMPVHSHVAMNFVRDSMRWRRGRGREGERGRGWRRGDGSFERGRGDGRGRRRRRDTRLTEDVFAAATDHQRLRSQGGERTDEIGDVGAHGGDDGWIVQIERTGRGHHANGEIVVEGVD